MLEPLQSDVGAVDSMAAAREHLLTANGLSFAALDRALGAAMSRQLEYADLYLQLTRYETWTVEDGIVKEGAYSIDQGVGVRAVTGERTGFSYSDQLDEESLQDAVSAARGIARAQGSGKIKVARPVSYRPLYSAMDPLGSMSDSDKVQLLADIDRRTRGMDSRVIQVMASLAGVYEIVLLQASDGTLAADVRPLVRMNVSVIMEKDGRREQGYAGGGGRGDYSVVTGGGRPLTIAAEAVRLAGVNMGAMPSPAGTMPVVLSAGWPGILLHEAIGHGLEGDFNRKGTSAFTGRIGERVATEQCTVVDDGTLAGRRGSLNVDDEGTPTQCTTLIEKGVLKGYMQDKTNARLMGMPITGNARRESFAHLTMPRMTNTLMLGGDKNPHEIIASVKNGLYAVNFGGGQVDITSGKFVFSAAEAYMIEDGKITYPVKGATLIGNGPDALTRVTMIGDDMGLDPGIGTCGKDGQSVPVGVGQPTLRIEGLTVGGTG